MRSHILWLLILQAVVLVALIIFFMPPSESRLDAIAKHAGTEAKRLHDLFVYERRTNPFTTLDDIPNNNPIKIKLLDALTTEQKALEQLIASRPKKLEYQYRLAQSLLLQEKREEGIALMNKIAPDNKAGFPKAHLYRANRLLRLPSRNNSWRWNNDKAIKHLSYVLESDSKNEEARELLAQLFFQKNRLDEAYDLYESLFLEDPEFYGELIRINERRGQAGLNWAILASATSRFSKQILLSLIHI